MFKFMKSKKGFSLVELMIVVVIMAILVAVAVPIFNSVTGNSRAKTCIDNQRQIISVLGNDLMMKGSTTAAGTFKVVNPKDGTPGYDDFDGEDLVYDDDDLKALFKTVPYCPSEGSSILVTITAGTGTNGGTSTVSTECHAGDNTDNPHVLTGGGSASA